MYSTVIEMQCSAVLSTTNSAVYLSPLGSPGSPTTPTGRPAPATVRNVSEQEQHGSLKLSRLATVATILTQESETIKKVKYFSGAIAPFPWPLVMLFNQGGLIAHWL